MPLSRITGPLTTTGLIEAVAADLEISEDAAKENVTAVFDVISRAAASGHDVAITNFGTFLSVRAPRRRARNPQTNELMWVPAHQKVRFKVSPRLAESVRVRNRTASTRKLPKGALTDARSGAGAAGQP